MILCDTNILIEFYKGNPQVLEVLSRVGPSSLAISAVTVGELYYGAMNRRELRKIQNHLALLRQVPLDEDISDLFLSLMNAYTLSHNLSIPDALIASTAIRNDMSLYTLNVKDFRFIPELQLYIP